MAFDWGDYLGLASTLEADKGSSFQEAALRSAVSRAYYAAYCYARNYARDQEGLLLANKPSDHGLVKRHHLKKGRADLASELDDLRQWRKSKLNSTVGDLIRHLPSYQASRQEPVDQVRLSHK